MFYWILLILVWSSSPKCMSYWKGDTYFSADVLGNSYCPEIITWPISNLTASQYVINDAIAQSLYGQLYNTYTNQTDPSLSLTCLGIARFAFCAYAYPTCSDGQQQIGNMCDWVCNLWNIRCSNQTEIYNTICKQKHQNTCSSQYFLVITTLLLSLIFII